MSRRFESVFSKLVPSDAQLLLIGAYTGPSESENEGIHVYRLDLSSGRLSHETVIKHVPNVSFMAIHPQSGLIYAVNEVEDFDNQPGGGVSVISRDSTGGFHVLQRQSSGGMNPAYISIEKTGRFALVANYKSGSVAMFPIQPDGQLMPACDVVQHVGASVHPERQTSPHPHCFIPDPTNRFAIAADLGLDRLLVYRMDLETGKLQKHSDVEVEAGSGPRHLIFNSTGEYAYLLNELNSTLFVYQFNPSAARLKRVQTVSTLPEHYPGENYCADLHLSFDEKYLYVSNRGHNSIVCFRVESCTGRLIYQSHITSGGDWPRIFAMDSDGRFMVAVHQRSHNAVVYKVNSQTGQLSHTGYEAELEKPVHVLFIN